MGLYEHMPDGMRQVVDEIVEILQPEPWPDRFAALYGLLCDKMEERGRRDPHHLLQEWSGVDDLAEAHRKRPVRKAP